MVFIVDDVERSIYTAYFASSVRAMAPEATGVAALVPSKSVTHMPSAPVVAYTGVGSTSLSDVTVQS